MNAVNRPAFEYSYGYIAPGGAWGTLMAYTANRILNFSNPAVSHDGVPTGSASANNALTFNNTASYVAAFRNRPPVVWEDSKNFTIYNDGNADLHVSRMSLEPGAAWITVTPFSATVPPGWQASIAVKVNYRDAPEGGNSYRLAISSDDPDENPAMLALQLTRHSISGDETLPPCAALAELTLSQLSLTIELPDGSLYDTRWTFTPELIFSLPLNQIRPLDAVFRPLGNVTSFNPQANTLEVPAVELRDAAGNPHLYSLKLELLPSFGFDRIKARIVGAEEIVAVTAE